MANIQGTAGDDFLQGTEGDDLIEGLGGNDTIEGKGGRDDIRGRAGDDVITLQYIPSQNVNPSVAGGDGVDTLILDLSQSNQATGLAESGFSIFIPGYSRLVVK
ncbi:MAG: hypothetical protein LH702_21405 [Phormidesmis sp. CAN_BIN44]|nr:hypothetical protein [Phormidesmis sp. CAN_BIN44]